VIVLTILFCGIEVHFTDAYQDAIAGAVPQIVELLKSMDEDVRSAGAKIIGNLTENRK